MLECNIRWTRKGGGLLEGEKGGLVRWYHLGVGDPNLFTRIGYNTYCRVKSSQGCTSLPPMIDLLAKQVEAI